jgi:carbamoyltransferase
LGINTDPNHFSAAVIRDVTVLSAIEQFKIRQHWSPREEAALPRDAILCALQAAAADSSEVDAIAFVSDIEAAEKFSPHIRSLGLNPKARIEHVDPRMAHAAAAFYASPFDRAAILLLGSGRERLSLWAGSGDGPRIDFEETSLRTSSLVEQYCRIYKALGFHSRTSNKLAWLSSSGEPEFIEVFRTFMSLDGAKPDRDALVSAIDFARPHNVAASLQQRATELIIQVAEDLCRQKNLSNLCVAGHLAENPLLVRSLEEHFGTNQVFVPPVPGMESLSIGAVLVRSKLQRRTPEEWSFPYPALGPRFTDSDIKAELDNCKLVSGFTQADDALTENVATAVTEGSLVGWFQGRCEFGHRALGFRSIVANPFTPYIDENINRFLKHREKYHPFVISVPEESASDYFQGVGANARTIASVYAVELTKKDLLAKFTVERRYVRVHTVRAADNALFWSLLQKVKSQTGHPLLINTSFNLPGEPLVMTPRDAIRSFYSSGLDVLAIGRFVVRK